MSRHPFISKVFASSALAMILLSGICPGPLRCDAAETTYIHEIINDSDGLSDNYVKAVLCDSRGIIWIGTQFGVEWYDGYKLRHVAIPGRTNVNVLQNSLFEDGDNIIVGTLSGVLVLDKGGMMKDFVDIPLSRPLVRTKDGKLWTPSISRGLRSIDPKDWSVTAYPQSGMSVTVDDRGRMYHLDYEGRITRSSDLMRSEELFVKVDSIFSKITVFRNFLFVIRDEESVVYDLEDGRVLKRGLPGVEAVCEDASGAILLATGDGIHRLNPDLELEDVKDPSGESISNHYSHPCICFDHDGGIWAGRHSGLVHLCVNRWNLKKTEVPSGGSLSLLDMDDDGKLWMVGSRCGLVRYDPRTGKLENVDFHGRSRDIRAIYVDGPWLWISTWDIEDCAIRLDRKTLETVKFDDFPGRASNFFRDSNGVLWIGANQGSGYEENGHFKLMALTHMATIMEDMSGNMWYGVKTNGISCKSADGSQKEYNSENGTFLSRGLMKLSVGKDGSVWALTEGDGLFRYDTAADRFVIEQRLPSGIFGRLTNMTVDSRGTLLITSGMGLIFFEPVSGNWSFLMKKGVFKGALAGKSICEGGDEDLYFGANGGFFRIDRQAMFDEGTGGQVIFTAFSVIQPTASRPVSFKLEGNIDDRDEIQLPHSCNSFRIYMTDLDFNRLKLGRLVYKLDGYDDQWKSVKDGSVSFLNIPAGHYRLSVRYIGPSGAFSGDERRLDINIRPPLYAGPIAIILYISMVVMLVMVISRINVKKSEEKAAAAAALKEAESEKAMYASKVEFLSSIAHEIKTPLSLVKLPVESLLGRASKDPLIKEDLETISRNSDVLSKLLDDLLDFQKLEHSSYRIDIIERDICTLTREIADRSRYLFERKRLDFTFDVPKSPVVMAIDTHIYDRILTNLLSNAAKYADSVARCRLSVRKGMAVFRIENDGIVVPADMREKIFTPFVRYEEGRHYVEGTGIGLYTSRKFATMLGGSLKMDDDDSLNRFVLSLPVIRKGVEETDSLVPQPAPAPALVQPLRFRKSVMLVEDNEEMVRVLIRAFEKEYDVISAGDGIQAMEKLQGGHLPSIIISDVMMPHMDGYELCRRVKNDERLSSIPFILLTAKPGDDSQLQGFRSGADAYVSKPFSMDVLSALVKTTLENRKKLSEHLAGTPVIDTAELELNSPDNKFLLMVQDYILENISNDRLRMEDIAEHCSVSLSSLQKRMKQISGMSPAEYVVKIRMREAVKLLADPSLSVAEISLRLGFTSHSYFSTCFRKEFGKTPSQWREENSIH